MSTVQALRACMIAAAQHDCAFQLFRIPTVLDRPLDWVRIVADSFLCAAKLVSLNTSKHLMYKMKQDCQVLSVKAVPRYLQIRDAATA